MVPPLGREIIAGSTPVTLIIGDKYFSSEFKIGDEVAVRFNENVISPCKVIKVAFTKGNIHYDVEMKYTYQQQDTVMGNHDDVIDKEIHCTRRLYNLNSMFVEPIV